MMALKLRQKLPSRLVIIILVMHMTLYADMLFIVNFIMNSFVLWVVSKITRKRHNRWLLVGAGVMSLLYTLLIAVEALRFANVAISSVVILTAGVMVAFRVNDIKLFTKLMAITYCISFAVGGLGMALVFMTDIPYAVYFIASDWQAAISWQLVLTGMFVSYIAIKLGLKLYERHSLKRQMVCNVQVFIGETGASFEALVDTGHSLKEPLSQSPVIIAEFEHVKDFLPDGLKVLFYQKKESNFASLTHDGSFYSRIRMIPFTSLGRANGMLVGFRPDRVTVEGAKEVQKNVVIGIYNDKLCNDGRYSGLMSPELVS